MTPRFAWRPYPALRMGVWKVADRDRARGRGGRRRRIVSRCALAQVFGRSSGTRRTSPELSSGKSARSSDASSWLLRPAANRGSAWAQAQAIDWKSSACEARCLTTSSRAHPRVRCDGGLRQVMAGFQAWVASPFHSNLMFARLMTSPHCTMSLSSLLPNCCGVSGSGVAPSFSNCSRTPGC